MGIFYNAWKTDPCFSIYKNDAHLYVSKFAFPKLSKNHHCCHQLIIDANNHQIQVKNLCCRARSILKRTPGFREASYKGGVAGGRVAFPLCAGGRRPPPSWRLSLPRLTNTSCQDSLRVLEPRVLEPRKYSVLMTLEVQDPNEFQKKMILSRQPTSPRQTGRLRRKVRLPHACACLVVPAGC